MGGGREGGRRKGGSQREREGIPGARGREGKGRGVR